VYVVGVHLAQYVVLLLGTVLELKICVPPVMSLVLNQPVKVYPVLVGVGRVPKVDPGVKFELVGETEPPLAFHEMVTVHLAQYVVLLLGTVLELKICVPPVLALVLNQPAKVYPVLVGVGSVPKVDPGIRFELVGETEPPFAFHEMVMSFIIHLAQNVVLLLGTVLKLPICVPPVLALVLNQPTKVYPALVGVGSVPKDDPGVRFELVGETEPPFAFHVMVTLGKTILTVILPLLVVSVGVTPLIEMEP